MTDLSSAITLIIATAIEIIIIFFAVKAYKRQIQIFDYQKTLLKHILETHSDVKKLKKELEEIKTKIDT